MFEPTQWKQIDETKHTSINAFKVPNHNRDEEDIPTVLQYSIKMPINQHSTATTIKMDSRDSRWSTSKEEKQKTQNGSTVSQCKSTQVPINKKDTST